MTQPDSLDGWVSIKDKPFDDPRVCSRLRFGVSWSTSDSKLCISCRVMPSTGLPSYCSIMLADSTPSFLSVSEAAGQASPYPEHSEWSTSMNLSELRAAHRLLCLVRPSLTPHLPSSLPDEPYGLLTYVRPAISLDAAHCNEVMNYLSTAVEICGERLVVGTLFDESAREEYFEQVGELRQRVLREGVRRAEEEMESALFLRDQAINMRDMTEVYGAEDSALLHWNISMAELYNYLLQPFLDLRELSHAKLREIKQALYGNLCSEIPAGSEISRKRSPKRNQVSASGSTMQVSLAASVAGSSDKTEEQLEAFTEWQESYKHALDRIQELYMEYYSLTLQQITAARERMLKDKQEYGQRSFDVEALERLSRLTESLSKDRLQLLVSKKKHYENQQDKVKQEIASLDESTVDQGSRPGAGVHSELARLETLAYEWQVKIYACQLDILLEEEKILRFRMNSLRKQIDDESEDSEFYDTVENEEDLEPGEERSSGAGVGVSKYTKFTDLRMILLQKKLQLICRKKAAIRNKKKSLTDQQKLKVHEEQERKERERLHHSIQIARDEFKKDQESKQTFIDEERRKTIERLRQYKVKYPTPSTLRPRLLRKSIAKSDINQSEMITSMLITTTSQQNTTAESSSVTSSCVISPSLTPNNTAANNAGTVMCSNSTQDILPLPQPNVPQNPPLTSAPPLPPPPPPPPPPMPSPSAPLSVLKATITAGKAAGSTKDSGGKLPESGPPLITLESIKSGRERLKKRSPPCTSSKRSYASSSSSIPIIDIMDLRRQRDKLRPVKDSAATASRQTSATMSHHDEHLRHLQEALERINRTTCDQESEEEEESAFDSDDFNE